MSNSNIFVYETRNGSDILNSVYDTRNIIYLQDKIKNIDYETNFNYGFNNELSPSLSRFGSQEYFMYINLSLSPNYFISIDKESSELAQKSPVIRYDYPCCSAVLCNTDVCCDKLDQQKQNVFLHNSYCIFCESYECQYLGENILHNVSIETEINEENKTCVNDVNYESIIVENQEINQCESDIIHTISDEFFVHGYNLQNSLEENVNSNSKIASLKQRHQYKCESCPKTFKTLANLKCHERIHANLRPYICLFCEQAFKQANHLVSHVRRHTGERPFQCPFCSKTFIQGTTLKIHIGNKHTDKKVRNENRTTLTKQLKPDINNNMKNYEVNNFYCEYCKKTYIGVSKKEHKKTHFKNDYPCSVCQKIFKKWESYEKHVKIHNPVLEYVFPQSSDIKQHTKRNKNILSKNAVGKYFCNICNKLFNNKSNLFVHYRIHTGERPYKCDLCHISFKQISHLKWHVGMHERKRLYVCSECNLRFPNHITAVNHVKNIHATQDAFLFKTHDLLVKKNEDPVLIDLKRPTNINVG